MKKIFILILAFVYLVVSSGIVVNMHYCMGKLADVSYNIPGDSHCGICGMDNSGCCHDDIKVVKLEDNHKSAAVIQYQLPVLAKAPPVNHLPFNTFLRELYADVILNGDSPPDLYTPSLTILHSVLRI